MVIDRFIAGLEIMQNLGAVDLSAEHDIVYANVDSMGEEIIPAVLERLEDLGWHRNDVDEWFYFYV